MIGHEIQIHQVLCNQLLTKSANILKTTLGSTLHNRQYTEHYKQCISYLKELTNAAKTAIIFRRYPENTLRCFPKVSAFPGKDRECIGNCYMFHF